MLLHNSNINVAIADILVDRKSHYDLPGLTLKNRQLDTVTLLSPSVPQPIQSRNPIVLQNSILLNTFLSSFVAFRSHFWISKCIPLGLRLSLVRNNPKGSSSSLTLHGRQCYEKAYVLAMSAVTFCNSPAVRLTNPNSLQSDSAAVQQSTLLDLIPAVQSTCTMV